MTWVERFLYAGKDHTVVPAVDQLRQGLPTDRLIGWIVTLVVTGIAFVVRLYRLGYPAQLVFDESYYAKDAWSYLQYGYEGTWEGDSVAFNQAFANGDYSALQSAGAWAVHPPLGKWLIAAGEALFGVSPFGWRISSVVFGALLVFVVIRLGRRLSRSTVIGGLAGLLLCFDGLHFVMSRIALLDIFQAFFIVAAVSCVVTDRDYFRNRLGDHIATSPGQTLAGQAGPFIFRPWLIAAGVLFGAGCAVKWNTIYPLAVFGVVVVVWSYTARRLAGARKRSRWALLFDGVPAFISMVIVGVGVYLATWIPWLSATGVHAREWGVDYPGVGESSAFGDAMTRLWWWHEITYDFHTNDDMATATHVYSSNPWGWPFLGRTIAIFGENDIQPGVDGCKAAAGDICVRVVTGLGTPLLWWAAAIALIVGLIWWLARADWRFGVTSLATLSTWIPWILAGSRPMFNFYAITMIPFMVIGLAMALGVILGQSDADPPRRRAGVIVVSSYVGLVVVNFVFFYPIYTGQLLTRAQWLTRMWFPGWA